ncbi:MAG TPA: hypothetical protein VK962_00135 [Actinomycetota bacterium]|jgi:hypothetical protein|nr:hypothetical protein [Actinomycetota bacterium]
MTDFSAMAPGERCEDMEGSPPDPERCRGPADLGKLHHDEEDDIWYECVFDSRRGVYTWAILPPVEESGSAGQA